jgi:hypothetical protein
LAIEYSKLGSLELNIAKKNLAHFNGLKAIQFAVVLVNSCCSLRSMLSSNWPF